MKSKLKWKLQTERIFRNSISLLVGPYNDIITLKSTLSYLEIAMFPAERKVKSMLHIAAVCTEVMQSIETAVQEVTSTLNYTSDAEHNLAFYCTGTHEVGQEQHPAEVVFYNNKPCTVECALNDRKHRCDLPNGCQYWFSEVGEVNDNFIYNILL